MGLAVCNNRRNNYNNGVIVIACVRRVLTMQSKILKLLAIPRDNIIISRTREEEQEVKIKIIRRTTSTTTIITVMVVGSVLVCERARDMAENGAVVPYMDRN